MSVLAGERGAMEAKAEDPAGNTSFYRRILVSILFVLMNIVAWRVSNSRQDGQPASTMAWELPFHPLLADEYMKSGVGLVTKDGTWEESNRHHEHDIKILGFTDMKYVSIAKVWYERLSALVGASYWQSFLLLRIISIDYHVHSLIFLGIHRTLYCRS